jgi:type I restriction enzyme S subunit
VSAELLLREFHRVTEELGAVARLRDFTWKLAVDGSLLHIDRQRWSDCTLADLGGWGSGGTPNKSHPEFYEGGIPWLVIGDLNDGLVSSAASTISDLGLANSSAKVVEPGAVLVAMYGSIGKLGLAGIRCATNQAIAHCVVNPVLVTPPYLMVALRSMRRELLARGQGGTQANISQTILKAWPIRLPPLAEQHCIVAKVDELMALCDELEAAQTNREARRDRLRTTSLRDLAAPEEPKENARFFLRHSARMITSPEHVVGVRQAILDLAVRGRLVPQDADGPAFADPDAPQRRTLPLITGGEIPFPAPSTWVWRRVGHVCQLLNGDRGRNYPNKNEYVGSGVSWINTGHIDPDGRYPLSG